MGAGGDAVGMVGTAADNPENGTGGIGEEQLGGLLRGGVVMVGEIVADELAAPPHAQGLETVAMLPVPQRQWLHDGVGIEKGCPAVGGNG